jgi:hypothetical protein
MFAQIPEWRHRESISKERPEEPREAIASPVKTAFGVERGPEQASDRARKMIEEHMARASERERREERGLPDRR